MENADDSDSPKIESLVEPIDPQPSLKGFRPNGFYPKRVRLENDDYEPVDPANHPVQEIQDDCDACGRYVTAQMRQMSKMQKFIAQRLISEVCFRGQISALQINTVFSNQSPTVFQQQSQQTQPLPVYAPRPTPFLRNPDYLISHQQNMRLQSHLSGVNTAGTTTPQFQSFVNLQQQQSEPHSTAAINHIVNMGQNENLP